MPQDKSLFSIGMPTLSGERVPQEDATLIQTRGPWSMESKIDDSAQGSGDDFELPDLPDPMAVTRSLPRNRPTPTPPPESKAQAPLPPPKLTGDEGKVIGGRYQIEGRIGEGGMGRVYRVKHLELGKQFALKIMRSLLADDDAARKAFFREARLASSLAHGGVVSIVDFGEDPVFGVYMVMELLEGEPLKRILQERGRFALRPACDIMLQVADAIHYVHEKGIVHCDLKSENVLLGSERTETGRRTFRVKLLDFGLARPHSGADRSATLSGTPAYIAPERIRGAAPQPSMDIYALGILFYELLTGAPPFTGSLETVLYQHVNEVPKPLSVVLGPGSIDESVEQLVRRALAKRPEDRQKNVGAFIYELRTAMEMLGFSRRRTRSKPSKRAGDDHVESLFAECPLPLAVFGSDGTILVGNKAFSVFVCGEAVDLRGVALSETSLVRACPKITHDIRSCAAEGRVVQTTLKTPTANGTAELLIWLTPAPDRDHVHCAVHMIGPVG